MNITIENTTVNDIDVDGNGYLAIPGYSKEIYYDEDNHETYDMGYYIIKYGYTNIAKLIDTGELIIWNDDNEMTPSEAFLLFRENYYKEKFKVTNIKFEPESCGNMWYGLTTNKLHIMNPISGKWYTTQLIEEE